MPTCFHEHKGILLGAILMALVVISPYWLFPLLAGDSYRGINLGEWDDDAAYITKGREILEGHSLANIFLKIGKNDLSDPHQTYLEHLLLAPIKLLGLSDIAKSHIVAVYIVYGFLGVIALILLIYFFIFHLSGNQLLSAAVGLFTIGGYTLVKFPHTAVTSAASDFNIFNLFARPMMPLYGLIALFIYINLLARSLKSSKKKYIIWAGISFGALFYVYPYTWTFASALTGGLFLIYIFLKDWAQVKKVFFISVFGLTIGFYAIFLLILFMSSAIGQQIASFTTLLHHTPAPFSKLSFFVLILTLIYAYKNREHKDWPILLSVVLASWITLNQQVITGRDPQGLNHYFWYFTIPTSAIIGSYLAWALVWGAEKGRAVLQKYGKILLWLVIAAAFLNLARQQYGGMLATWNTKEYAQNYRPIIDALNRAPKPGVILTSDLFYGRFFTVYTDHDLFWAMHAFNFATPIERMKGALYLYVYLDRDARDDFTGTLHKIDAGYQKGYGYYPSIYVMLAAYWSGLDSLKYSRGLASGDPAVIQSRDKTANFLSEEYKRVTSDPKGIVNLLKKAEVNYIVWDKNKNPEWDLSVIPGLQEITASNNIYLYAFK